MRFLCALAGLAMSAAQGVQAAGTAAGATIANSVTLDFDLGGTPQQIISNTDTVTVQELIDVVAVWQDAANVQTASPDTDRVLTFLVRNTGNGIETFTLGIDNSPATGDDFDPLNPRIHLDGNGNGSYDGPVTDPLYIPGSNDPLLDANGTDSSIIFVLNDIPTGRSDGETGDSQLQVQSATTGAAGSAPGTVLPGAGDGGIDAVVGTNNADADVIGSYQILNAPLDVEIVKSAQVINDGNSCTAPPCNPVPGATIRYALQVDITGTGSAGNLVITDSIPVNTTYVPASISLDAVPQTDIVDADAGSFGSGIVTVDLGSVPGPATRVITLDVTID
ncbi:MAG: hypothetical protein ACC648_09370 [Thiohalobacterales bacterium]